MIWTLVLVKDLCSGVGRRDPFRNRKNTATVKKCCAARRRGSVGGASSPLSPFPALSMVKGKRTLLTSSEVFIRQVAMQRKAIYRAPCVVAERAFVECVLFVPPAGEPLVLPCCTPVDNRNFNVNRIFHNHTTHPAQCELLMNEKFHHDLCKYSSLWYGTVAAPRGPPVCLLSVFVLASDFQKRCVAARLHLLAAELLSTSGREATINEEREGRDYILSGDHWQQVSRGALEGCQSRVSNMLNSSWIS